MDYLAQHFQTPGDNLSSRVRQALRRTLERRPDLLNTAPLAPADSATLLNLGADAEQLAHWGAPPPPALPRRQ